MSGRAPAAQLANTAARAARRAALIEDVTWMARTGETLQGAAARLGVHPASLARALARAGRADLTRALASNTATGTGVRPGRWWGAA